MGAAGLTSPGLIPAGLIVLETTGRKSRTPRRTPLVGGLLEGRLIVSTVRGTRSQWVRNALTTAEVPYWLLGAEHHSVATILAADVADPSPETFPPLISQLVAGPLAAAVALGWAFAVITPVSAGQ